MLPVRQESITWHKPSESLLQLADRMNVAVERFGVAKGLLNAFTDSKGTVVLGDELSGRLSTDDIESVLAHELGHAAWHRTPYFQLAQIATVIVGCRFIERMGGLHPLLVVLCWRELQFILYSMMRPVRWLQELGADAAGAQTIGPERMQRMLWKLLSVSGWHDPASSDHPPLRFRLVALMLG